MKRLVSLLMTLIVLCSLPAARADEPSVTAADYLGYWEVVKAEVDGFDVTAEMLSYGGQAVTFNEDSALLHGAIVTMVDDLITVTPVTTPCAWVFQPDGSMDVLQPGHPLTFRKSGDFLLMDDQDVLLTYAPVSAPGMPMQQNSPTKEDYVGYWEAVTVELNGMDISAYIAPPNKATSLILRADGQGESCNVVQFVQDPDWFPSFDGEESTLNWQLDENGGIFVIGMWNYLTYSFTESGEPYNEQEHTEIVPFTLQPAGDLLTLEHSAGSGRTLRITFRKVRTTVTQEDFLGEWDAVGIIQDGKDVTFDVLGPTCEIGIAITPDQVLMTQTGKATRTHGWRYLLNGAAEVGGYISLHFEDDLLVSQEWGTTTYYCRKLDASTPATPAAPATADDYLGYWKLTKMESDGMDMTQVALQYGEQGITFTSDLAIIHGQDVIDVPGHLIVTPRHTPAVWVFEPDGSIQVIHDGGTFITTYRLDGDQLVTFDGYLTSWYVRAEAPADTGETLSGTFTADDLLGQWHAVRAESFGQDVSEEYLPQVVLTLNFEPDRALFVIDEPGAPEEGSSLPCDWKLLDGGYIRFIRDGMTIHYRFTGEYILMNEGPVTVWFARTDASETSAVDPEKEAAFLSVFTHPATEQDTELVLISAHAAEKVYRPADVHEYLTSLGFPSERIRPYDYTCDAPHYVALTLASREVVNAQGQTVTLYAAIVRGTTDTAEWISNFDMGGGDVALGFNQAALRVLAHLTDYMELYPPVDGGEPLLWLAGHSRGAAVANLIAGQYATLPPEQVYCVTFATPNVAKDTHRAANILNFVIDGDVVTNVPFTSWGFDRHGLTIHYTRDRLLDVAITPAEDMQLLLAFLGSVPQADYYEMTLEVLHSDVIRARSHMTLSDMLSLNIAGVARTFLDPADETLLTLLDLTGDMLINTIFQREMRILLGDVMPTENRATFLALCDVGETILANAGSNHAMDTYVKWIECLYYDRPTIAEPVPGSGGGGSR